MKYLTILLLLGIGITVYGQETDDTPFTGSKISFTEISHDFGDIKQGDVVSHVFKFENTGDEPLILSDVKTSCGCTAPEWPKEPIVPGGTSTIKVVFNSGGKVGVQNKSISVYSNAVNNPSRVKIVTNVLTESPNN